MGKSREKTANNPVDKLIKIRSDISAFVFKYKICFHGPVCKQNYSDLPTDYPIHVMNEKVKHENIDIGGVTFSNSTDWIQISPDICVAVKNNITSMHVLVNKDWNRTVYHFIHEIAHTVTLNELHKIPPDSQLQPFATKQGKYTACHHPATFYRNLAILLRIAKDLKVWVPSSDFLGFKPELLERYDSFTVS